MALDAVRHALDTSDVSRLGEPQYQHMREVRALESNFIRLLSDSQTGEFDEKIDVSESIQGGSDIKNDPRTNVCRILLDRFETLMKRNSDLSDTEQLRCTAECDAELATHTKHVSIPGSSSLVLLFDCQSRIDPGSSSLSIYTDASCQSAFRVFTGGKQGRQGLRPVTVPGDRCWLRVEMDVPNAVEFQLCVFPLRSDLCLAMWLLRFILSNCLSRAADPAALCFELCARTLDHFPPDARPSPVKEAVLRTLADLLSTVSELRAKATPVRVGDYEKRALDVLKALQPEMYELYDSELGGSTFSSYLQQLVDLSLFADLHRPVSDRICNKFSIQQPTNSDCDSEEQEEEKEKAPPAPSEWPCARCTLLNADALSACEVCAAPRPPPEPKKVEEAGDDSAEVMFHDIHCLAALSAYLTRRPGAQANPALRPLLEACWKEVGDDTEDSRLLVIENIPRGVKGHPDPSKSAVIEAISARIDEESSGNSPTSPPRALIDGERALLARDSSKECARVLDQRSDPSRMRQVSRTFLPAETDERSREQLDEKGIVYYFATHGGTRKWENPHKAGDIICACSSIHHDSRDVSAIVGREAVRCLSSPTENSWFTLRFKDHRIQPRYYTLRHYTSWNTEALRSWRLEGSNDGTEWQTIREHVNDETICRKGACYTFALPSVHIGGFEYFRINMTNRNSNDHWYLALSGFEIYGQLTGADLFMKPKTHPTDRFAVIPLRSGDPEKISSVITALSDAELSIPDCARSKLIVRKFDAESEAARAWRRAPLVEHGVLSARFVEILCELIPELKESFPEFSEEFSDQLRIRTEQAAQRDSTELEAELAEIEQLLATSRTASRTASQTVSRTASQPVFTPVVSQTTSTVVSEMASQAASQLISQAVSRAIGQGVAQIDQPGPSTESPTSRVADVSECKAEGKEQKSQSSESPADISNGVSNGVSDGVSTGVTNGVSNGISDGILNGISDGISSCDDSRVRRKRRRQMLSIDRLMELFSEEPLASSEALQELLALLSSCTESFEISPESASSASSGISRPDTDNALSDASQMSRDTGQMSPDTGQISPDTGIISPDTSRSSSDTSQVARDSSQPHYDHSTRSENSTPPIPESKTAFGVSHDQFYSIVGQFTIDNPEAIWEWLRARGYDDSLVLCAYPHLDDALRALSQWHAPPLRRCQRALVDWVSAVAEECGEDSPTRMAPGQIPRISTDIFDRYPALKHCGVTTRSARIWFTVLKRFNSLAERLLPLIDLRRATDHFSLGGALRAARTFIFRRVKLTHVELAMDATAVRGLRPPVVTIDRLELAEKKDSGRALSFSRDTHFGVALHQLEHVAASRLRPRRPHGSEPFLAFEVEFKGQHVVGTAGPYRQFFAEVGRELAGTDCPLFMAAPSPAKAEGTEDGRTLIIRPSANSSAELQHFEYLGLLFGLCLRTGVRLSLNLAAFVWKPLVYDSLRPRDLAEIDARTFQILKGIVDCSASTFSSTVNERFVTSLSDRAPLALMRGGARLPVTYEAREEYAQLVFDARLHEHDRQIEAVRRGMAKVIPLQLLHLLSWHELELAVCGTQTIDIDLLRRHTEYAPSVDPHAPHVCSFWDMLSGFGPTERRSFVRFAWAQDRLPVDDDEFERSGTRLLINPCSKTYKDPDDALPTAHTCFFNLELPEYSSLEVMRSKFLYAINQTLTMDADEENNIDNARPVAVGAASGAANEQ
eukprot:209798_1